MTGPGSCLSSLHCLVLPQEELYTSPSEPAAPLSVRPETRARSPAGKMPLGVHMTASGERNSVCVWDRMSRGRSRSASPSPSKTRRSPCSESVKGMC